MSKRPLEESDVSSESDQDGGVIESYPDGEPVTRNNNGRVVPRLHRLPTVPKHEADQGFAPVRFVSKYIIANGMLEQLRAKASGAARSSTASPALRTAADAWRMALVYVDTMSLRTFALACTSFAMLARIVLQERLVTHPFITSPIHLSEMQYHAFSKAVHKRQNLFITGEAGSGKTLLLRTIVDTLRRTDAETGDVYPYKYFEEIEALHAAGYDESQKPELAKARDRRFLNVLVVAPTGTAAEMCGGQTGASVFGIAPLDVVTNWERYKPAPGRGDRDLVTEADVLIYDEISMLSRQGLEHTEKMARYFKNEPKKLFGGMQVIFFGDFAQLPPVSKGKDAPDQLRQRCFMSHVWRSLFEDPFSIDSTRMILLPCSMRQGSEHAHFIKCLRELRMGQASALVSTLINSRHYKLLLDRKDPCMYMPSVVIASTNANVDAINNDNLRFLTVKQAAAQASYTSWLNRVRDPEYADYIDLPVVTMVVGALVSLTRNALYYRLSNGSIGKVKELVDLTSAGTLKRIKSGELLFLSNISYSIVERLSGELSVRSAPNADNVGTNTSKFPVVEFNSQPGKQFIVAYWTTPLSITKAEKKKSGELRRFEVPLRVAFASSAHRWQGGTIPLGVAARVQLEDAFMPELLYVILSRVRSPSQLIVTTLPKYDRFYGPNARISMCPETKRFLTAQAMRLEQMLLKKEELAIERRLLERKRERSCDDRPDRVKCIKPNASHQPNMDI